MKKCIFYLAGIVLAVLLSGCSAVPFHKRRLLSSRFMKFDCFAEADLFHSEGYSAREGASGGFSQGGGGGCGCK